MKTAPIIVLSNDERKTLTTWSRGRSTPARWCCGENRFGGGRGQNQ